MDDANEIYYAQLLEEESTFTVMAALREVIESKGRLRTTYIAEFDQKFSVPAKEAGSAFIAYRRQDLDLVFTLQTERTVARDNTISNDKRLLQSEKTKWRYTLSGYKVKVYEHTDGTLSIGYCPHLVGRYSAEGTPLADVPKQRQSKASAKKKQAKLPRKNSTGPAVEMTPLRKATKRVASLRGLEKSRQKAA